MRSVTPRRWIKSSLAHAAIADVYNTLSFYGYLAPKPALAVVYSSLNEEEKAIDLLEESYRDRCNNLVFINIQPAFDSLRSNQRFIDLIQRLGLVKEFRLLPWS